MTGAVTEAGIATRIETCTVHGIPFPQVWFPAIPEQVGFWCGSCPECEKDERKNQAVTEFLLSQEDAIAGEAAIIIQEPAHQAAIKERTNKDLDADVAEFKRERKPLWEAYNSDLEWNQVVSEIEDRKRAEFLSR